MHSLIASFQSFVGMGMNNEVLSIPVVLGNDAIIDVFLSNPAIRNEKQT
jgi:hypothetical protein